jgi:uncharacterized delta-60 repeat protein
LIVGDVDGPILGDDGLLAARFNTDGTLDMSYGTGGSTVVPVESVSGRVGTLQLDGKLIIAGEYPVGPHYSASIVRLNTGGTLDGAFGASGIVNRSVPAGTDEEIYGLATQKDGKILVSADSTTSPSGVALMRILDKDPPPVPLTAKISAPTKSKLRAKKFKSFSGTAAGDGLAKVEVAIGLADSKLLKKSKKCLFVTGTSGKTKKFKAVKKKCAPKKWLKATGTTTWSYKFKKKLAPGKYKLYVRAVGAGGAVSAATTKNLKIVK